jgi:L,D-transpeptidase catalytic domain
VGIPAADHRKRHDDARHRPARHPRRAAHGAGLAGALTLALLLPATAAAQVPPAQGTMTLSAEKVMRDGDRRVALTGTSWRVHGKLRPFVPGQTVVVRFFRNGRKIHERTEQLQPGSGGAAGEFVSAFQSRSAGRVVVSAVHLATPELDTVRSGKVRVNVMRPVLGGSITNLFQKGLARMGYAVSRTGVFDDATARAVMAYRKVNGMPRSYSSSESIVRRVLAGKGAFKPRYPGDGRHVEADLSRQVLALVNPKGRVHRVYHTSTGTSATPTVMGRFRVYRKSIGTNALGMLHSSYFIRGYAIHGYPSVPAYPASHGCLRVPNPNAWSIYEWVRMGTVVRVYP